jgi:hypothetical protein
MAALHQSLSFVLRFPGPPGDTVLMVTELLRAIGELIGVQGARAISRAVAPLERQAVSA